MNLKFYYSILFIVLFSGSATAQNWKTVRLNDTTWFASTINTDANVMRVTWVNSVELNGSDTTFHFFKSLRDSAAVNTCIDTASPSWLGTQFIRLANGDELYFNGVNDTVRIRTLASLSDTWTLYEHANGKRYEATVTGVAVTTIDGVQDSTKTIALQAYYGTTTVADWYNGNTLILSKNHGWLQTIDMYRFQNFYDDWDSLGAQIDTGLHVRLSKNIGNIDVNDLNPFARYQPGNEWIEYSTYESFPGQITLQSETYIHDSVVAVQPLNANEIAATIKTVRHYTQHQPSAQVHYDTSYLHTDTLMANTSHVYVKHNIFPEYNRNGQDVHLGPFQNPHLKKYRVDTFCTADRYIIKSRALYSSSSGLQYTGNCLQIWPSVSGVYHLDWDYMDGFGRSHYRLALSGMTDINVSTRNHLYIKLGNCVYGTKIYVGPNDVGEIGGQTGNITIYPVPAAKEIFLKGLKHGEKADIILFDVTSRQVKAVKELQEEKGIDIAALPAGYYVAQITIGDNTQFQKILIAR